MQEPKHLTLVDLSDPFEMASLESGLNALKGLQDKLKADVYGKACMLYFYRMGARWGRAYEVSQVPEKGS